MQFQAPTEAPTSILTTTEYQELYKMKWLENLDQIELKLAIGEKFEETTTTSSPEIATLPIC